MKEKKSRHSRSLSAQWPSKQDLQPHSSCSVVMAFLLNHWSRQDELGGLISVLAVIQRLGFISYSFTPAVRVKRGSMESRYRYSSATFPCWHEQMWNAAACPFLAGHPFGLMLEKALLLINFNKTVSKSHNIFKSVLQYVSSSLTHV